MAPATAVDVVCRTCALANGVWPSSVSSSIEALARAVTVPACVVMLCVEVMRPVPRTPLSPVRLASAFCRAVFRSASVVDRPQSAPRAVSSRTASTGTGIGSAPRARRSGW